MLIPITITTSGDNTLAASQGADRHNKLVSAVIVSDTDTAIKFKDDNGDLTGAFTLKAGTPLVLPAGGNSDSPAYWLVAVGALKLNLSVNANVGGWLNVNV